MQAKEVTIQQLKLPQKVFFCTCLVLVDVDIAKMPV